MADRVPALTDPPEGYANWLSDLKARIHTAQQRAALAVNTELLLLYWRIGSDIRARQAEQGWGRKITERLSHDLREAFPDMRGFSRTNLDYMRSFAAAWPVEAISQQAVGRLPWGHNLVLLAKIKGVEDRLAYAEAAVHHGWSRTMLETHIEARSLERQGKAVTNFDATLPAAQSDLARESLKDPYKHPDDGPTLGLLLCKTKNEIVAEYALRDYSKPLGVSEYRLVESLPEPLQTSLPTIEQIERELARPGPAARGSDGD